MRLSKIISYLAVNLRRVLFWFEFINFLSSCLKISTPRPAVQQLTNSSPLTPAISSRWGFREKVLDSSPIESYHGHTNKATEILWKN